MWTHCWLWFMNSIGASSWSHIFPFHILLFFLYYWFIYIIILFTYIFIYFLCGGGLVCTTRQGNMSLLEETEKAVGDPQSSCSYWYKWWIEEAWTSMLLKWSFFLNIVFTLNMLIDLFTNNLLPCSLCLRLSKETKNIWVSWSHSMLSKKEMLSMFVREKNSWLRFSSGFLFVV